MAVAEGARFLQIAGLLAGVLTSWSAASSPSKHQKGWTGSAGTVATVVAAGAGSGSAGTGTGTVVVTAARTVATVRAGGDPDGP